MSNECDRQGFEALAFGTSAEILLKLPKDGTEPFCSSRTGGMERQATRQEDTLGVWHERKRILGYEIW
jgi:hypothetical protein